MCDKPEGEVVFCTELWPRKSRTGIMNIVYKSACVYKLLSVLYTEPGNNTVTVSTDSGSLKPLPSFLVTGHKFILFFVMSAMNEILLITKSRYIYSILNILLDFSVLS